MSERMVVTHPDFHRRILARYRTRTGKGVFFPPLIFRKALPVLPAKGSNLFFLSHGGAKMTRSVTLHLHLHGVRTLAERTWFFTRLLPAGHGHPRSGPIASVRPLPRARTRISGYPGSGGGFPVFVNLTTGDGTTAPYHGLPGDRPWTGRPGMEDVPPKEKGTQGAPPLPDRTRFPGTAGEKTVIPRRVVLGSGHASRSMDLPSPRRRLTDRPGRVPLRTGGRGNGFRLSGPLAASAAGTRTLPYGSGDFSLPSAPGLQVLLRKEGAFPAARFLPAATITGRAVPGTPTAQVAGPSTPHFRPGAGKERDLFRVGPPAVPSPIQVRMEWITLSRSLGLTRLVPVPGNPRAGEQGDQTFGGKQDRRATHTDPRERGYAVRKAASFLQGRPGLYGKTPRAEAKAASFLKIAPGLTGKGGFLPMERKRPRLTGPEHPYRPGADAPLFPEGAGRETGGVDPFLYVKNRAGGPDREVENLKTAVKAALKTMEERADQLQRQRGTETEDGNRVRLLADQVYRLIEQKVLVGRERRGIF